MSQNEEDADRSFCPKHLDYYEPLPFSGWTAASHELLYHHCGRQCINSDGQHERCELISESWAADAIDPVQAVPGEDVGVTLKQYRQLLRFCKVQADYGLDLRKITTKHAVFISKPPDANHIGPAHRSLSFSEDVDPIRHEWAPRTAEYWSNQIKALEAKPGWRIASRRPGTHSINERFIPFKPARDPDGQKLYEEDE